VRLGAIVAASWLEKAKGRMVLEAAKMKTLDEWMVYAYETAVAHLNGVAVIKPKVVKKVETNLKGDDLALFSKGKEVYSKEGYCVTCHQADGNGLTASGFPPLSGTEWVTGDQVRLVKVILKGLMGPIEVNGKQYEGMVPMTPFEGLSDDDVAAVATYIRNSFGNSASPIQPSLKKTDENGIINSQLDESRIH